MEKPSQPIFETYPDKAGKWRWRLKSIDGEIVAYGEPYASESDVRGAIFSLRPMVSIARVEEVTE